MEDSHEPWRKNFYYKFWDIKQKKHQPYLLISIVTYHFILLKSALKLIINEGNKEDFFEIYESTG